MDNTPGMSETDTTLPIGQAQNQLLENPANKKIFISKIINMFLLVVIMILCLLTYISVNENLKNVNIFINSGIDFFNKTSYILDYYKPKIDKSIILFDETMNNLNNNSIKLINNLNEISYKAKLVLDNINNNDLFNNSIINNVIQNYNNTINDIRNDNILLKNDMNSVINNMNNTINKFHIQPYTNIPDNRPTSYLG